MNDWNPRKPFGFLRTVGKRAIRHSLHLVGDVTKRVATSSDEKLSIALFTNPESHARCSLETLRRLVFTSDCDVVRGLALRAASKGYLDKEACKAVMRVYREVLLVQFNLAEHLNTPILSGLTKNWLEYVVMIVQECELNEAKHQERVQCDNYNFYPDLFSDDPTTFRRAVSYLDKNDVPPLGFVDRCKDLIRTKGNFRLTMTAIRPLVWYVKGDDRNEVKRLLADIVSDTDCDIRLRDVAYQALFELDDAPVNSWPITKEALGHFSFPADIDWSFVNKFLLEG